MALVASIQVSAQPVAPSAGISSLAGNFAASRVLAAIGQAAATTASPLRNRSTTSDESAQYFLISGFCALSSATAASSCGIVSS